MVHEVEDSHIVWRCKVTAILHVHHFGGRISGFNDDGSKWMVERRPEECLRQIQGQLAAVGVLLMA